MKLTNTKFLVFGLGVTGKSAVSALLKEKAIVSVCEDKDPKDTYLELEKLGATQVEVIENCSDDKIGDFDFILKSPGIPPRHSIIKAAKERGVPMLSDIELSYMLQPEMNTICITGTNGKTTTTLLTSAIIDEAGIKTASVGNIGKGILDEIGDDTKDKIFVIEASSFQLEYTIEFKPHVAVITNIGKDHLDWHESIENYISSKLKIFTNQKAEDFLILNYEDTLLREIEKSVESRIIWFSSKRELEKGLYIKHGMVVYSDGKTELEILSVNSVQIPGLHNLENVLAAAGASICIGIETTHIRNAVAKFKGAPHRLEPVRDITGVSYYNDSKGTNPESVIKALESFERPVILIAGGYDKGADYTELLNTFKIRGKALILMGETAESIRTKAYELGIEEIYMANGMKEAVEIAERISTPGDVVLLSPACASWDSYKNFEERGEHFKSLVNEIAG
ncbi:MAG: UDP-N-acetylmuramoyl-L-alanine--D-glutamate ligase [Gudongella sp.]|jgi:UDP-N-acetylmuramoylalanine--D-glutamate ligase|nr:UDP-N-acetylmuramoyl-L-alanine--D-glutamate ligase [Gudongella sp.]